MAKLSRTLALAGLVVVILCISRLSDLGAPERRQVPITVWADEATYPVAQTLINAFESEHPDYQVTMIRGSTNQIARAIADDSSIAAITLFGQDSTNFMVPVAYENLLLEPGSAVDPGTSISVSQARDLIAGKITSWGDITGEDVPVQLVIFHDFHPVRLGMDNWLGPALSVSSEARTVSSAAQMESALREESYGLAISVSSLYVDSTRVLEIDDTSPFFDDVFNPRYPIQIPVLFISQNEPTDGLGIFLDWISSEAGASVLENDLVVP